MEQGHLYFLTDQYYKDFADTYLMKNKESVAGKEHDRPCFFAVKDKDQDLFWMIPLSSQVDKFKEKYVQKTSRYGRCDTLAFGNVLGSEKVFLIQNMCPVTSKYIKNEYMDQRANIPVRVDGLLEKELIKKAQKAIQMSQKGMDITFTNIKQIERKLLRQLRIDALEAEREKQRSNKKDVELE